MKKVIASFTIAVYFAFACGVMVNYHFCMDRYSSFRLYQPAGDWCPTCGMHTKKGCCHDEVRILKLQNDYQNATTFFSFHKIPPAVITPSEFLTAEFVSEKVVFNSISRPPPLLSQQDIYLQNRVFRI